MKIVLLVLLVGVVYAAAQETSSWGISRRIMFANNEVCFPGDIRTDNGNCVTRVGRLTNRKQPTLFKPPVATFAHYTEREVYEDYKFAVESAHRVNPEVELVYEPFSYSERDLLDLLQNTGGCRPNSREGAERACVKGDHYDHKSEMCYHFSKEALKECPSPLMHLYRRFYAHPLSEWRSKFTTQADLDRFHKQVEELNNNRTALFPDAYDAIVYAPFATKIPVVLNIHEDVIAGALILVLFCFGMSIFIHQHRSAVTGGTIRVELTNQNGIKTIMEIAYAPGDRMIDVFAKVPQYRIDIEPNSCLKLARTDFAYCFKNQTLVACPWTADQEKLRREILAHAGLSHPENE